MGPLDAIQRESARREARRKYEAARADQEERERQAEAFLSLLSRHASLPQEGRDALAAMAAAWEKATWQQQSIMAAQAARIFAGEEEW